MDIARAGVIMCAYLFIVVIFYIVLSSPFDDMMTAFEDANITGSDTQVDAAGSTNRIVFNLFFAGLVFAPILYFVVWVFHREPDWRYPR